MTTALIAAKFYVQFIQDFLHWPLYQTLLAVQSIKLSPVGKLVPLDRVELSRHFWQQILSLLCLPFHHSGILKNVHILLLDMCLVKKNLVVPVGFPPTINPL